MNKRVVISLFSFFLLHQGSMGENYHEQKYEMNGLTYHSAPWISHEVLDLAEVEEWRKRLIRKALRVRKESSWIRYVYGSADLEKGGFDCSGAMQYVLAKEWIEAPRTSRGQFKWVSEAGRMNPVSTEAETLAHKDFQNLQPGDLVFWSAVQPEGEEALVSHVGMYVGRIKEDGHPVMICASKGRKYRGVRCDGYGVFDFGIPKPTSPSKIVGYGSVK